MNKKLEVVDFLRGFAIFTIVLMHLTQNYLPGTLNKAAAFGGAGVHVFFLVSGFGLYLSYLRRPVGYGEFLKKRFGKVYWPYAIAVIVWIIWNLVSRGKLMLQEGLSHLLLYKMFIHELDVSFCYPYWFISTIIQFYLCWPLIVRLIRSWGGQYIAIAISIAWSTIVGILGFEELRPWSSFFLQYLWEFCLGMWIAERIYEGNDNLVDVREMKYSWLLVCAIAGMGLSAFMAWNGGWLKLYNDIPSLMGYLSVALLIYKIGMEGVYKFFVQTSGFGYELYLVHSLVFVIMAFLLKGIIPLYLMLILSLIGAYTIGYAYSWLLKKTNLE